VPQGTFVVTQGTFVVTQGTHDMRIEDAMSSGRVTLEPGKRREGTEEGTSSKKRIQIIIVIRFRVCLVPTVVIRLPITPRRVRIGDVDGCCAI
jgi:hypothetical protein